MATLADLGVRVLKRLAVIGAVETASAEDAALAQQKVTDAHNMLAAMGKTRWPLLGTPDYAVPAVVECAAALAAPEYEIRGDDAPKWLTGEMMLARLTAVPYSPREDQATPDAGYA